MSFNYCTLSDVRKELMGLDVSDLPTSLPASIEDYFIPAAKREIDSFCGESFDSKRVREFLDGNNLAQIPLRHKPILQVDVVTARLVPSMKWIFFKRWFYIKSVSHDGTVVSIDGGVEPVSSSFVPTFETPYTYAVGSGLTPEVSVGFTATVSNSTEQYERSDLFIDSANGLLIIPPRVLFIEAQGIPFYNYTWLQGHRNIEVGYTYGYKDIDSLPFELRVACAKLVAAKVLQQKGMWVSAGTKSISDGGCFPGSKSFGEGAFSTEIKALKEEAYNILARYKRITV